MGAFLEKLKIPLVALRKPSVIAMVLANLVPLYGVIFLGWQVFAIMLLFWIENVIIGVFNVLKMAFVSTGGAEKTEKKTTLIPFFCVHYGIFTVVHGSLIFAIFGGMFEGDNLITSTTDAFKNLLALPLEWAILALAFSHAVSFFINYIAGGERNKTTVDQLMVQPYVRVVILHLTILFGGFLVMLMDSPVAGLVFLITLKTYVDIKSHTKQHGFNNPEGNRLRSV